MTLPNEITKDQAEDALRALGITGMYGVAAVYIDAREETVVVTTRLTDKNGQYLLFNGDCAYQEHVIPVVDGPVKRGGIVVQVQQATGGSAEESFAAGRASALHDLRRRGVI